MGRELTNQDHIMLGIYQQQAADGVVATEAARDR
jgi:hypothetical protein